jgi:DNA-binding NtrC family response regulator
MAAIATPALVRSRTRILIASADAALRKRVMKDPLYADSQSEEAVGGAHALSKLLHFSCDSVLLDRNLPDLDATEVAEQIRKQFPRVDVEMFDARFMSLKAQDTEVREEVDEAGDAAKTETFGKPGLPHFAAPVTARIPTVRSNTSAVSCTGAGSLPGMIGPSDAMQEVYELVRMVAHRDTTVLVTGETGTGKELVAGAIHQLSKRSRNPFVIVNCAAIPEALLEAELFGHARGAFTGAVQSRLGRIHVAQGGTLFLDEIGELPLSMQAKLLRFLQNGEVQRLGSSDVYRVDVRVVCATNVRLQELVKARQFREDLYYRLAVFPIGVPPLRDRVGDIAALSDHFLEKLAREAGLPRKYLSATALTYLQEGRWSGNVRELQHSMERAFILSGNESELHVEHFRALGSSAELREV